MVNKNQKHSNQVKDIIKLFIKTTLKNNHKENTKHELPL